MTTDPSSLSFSIEITDPASASPRVLADVSALRQAIETAGGTVRGGDPEPGSKGDGGLIVLLTVVMASPVLQAVVKAVGDYLRDRFSAVELIGPVTTVRIDKLNRAEVAEILALWERQNFS